MTMHRIFVTSDSRQNALYLCKYRTTVPYRSKWLHFVKSLIFPEFTFLNNNETWLVDTTLLSLRQIQPKTSSFRKFLNKWFLVLAKQKVQPLQYMFKTTASYLLWEREAKTRNESLLKVSRTRSIREIDPKSESLPPKALILRGREMVFPRFRGSPSLDHFGEWLKLWNQNSVNIRQ